MANPTNPSHPAEFLAALAAQMIPGTTIATVVIQKGIDALGVPLPALILNCPSIHRVRKANNAKQAIFTVHGMYLTRAETDGRTLEQILADMTTDLCTAADNVDADTTLGLGPTVAGETIDINVDSPVDTSAFGTPMVVGELILQVKGPWYTST